MDEIETSWGVKIRFCGFACLKFSPTDFIVLNVTNFNSKYERIFMWIYHKSFHIFLSKLLTIGGEKKLARIRKGLGAY
jgi:hypothetical protein